MTITYVILHYLAIKDTIACVESIQNNVCANTSINTFIVIVDNASPNNSYLELEKRFGSCNSIKLIKNSENYGFAKGNNVGIRYATKDLDSDFVVVLNNDSIIEQNDFNEIIVKKYYEYKFAILGPDIITADGCHQNPGRVSIWSFRELIAFQIKTVIKMVFNSTNAMKNHTKRKKCCYRQDTLKIDKENVTLHGACIILSRSYTELFNGFYPSTFLYMEEDILKLIANYYHLEMLYTPELRIFHKEDAATNLAIHSNDKNMFKLRNELLSSKELFKLKLRIFKKQEIKF